MSKALHTTSTLTDRYQTTIPETVRRALHLGKRDKIEFTIENNGKVILSRVDDDDPVISEFLAFLTNDMKAHPEHITVINSAFIKRANSLVKGVEVDLDEPLDDKDK